MKISTNSIGNYNPYKISNQKLMLNKTTDVKDLQKVADLSKSEKNFFKSVYPDNTKEILDYHFYKSSGKMSGVSVGSLFDKRG